MGLAVVHLELHLDGLFFHLRRQLLHVAVGAFNPGDLALELRRVAVLLGAGRGELACHLVVHVQLELIGILRLSDNDVRVRDRTRSEDRRRLHRGEPVLRAVELLLDLPARWLRRSGRGCGCGGRGRGWSGRRSSSRSGWQAGRGCGRHEQQDADRTTAHVKVLPVNTRRGSVLAMYVERLAGETPEVEIPNSSSSGQLEWMRWIAQGAVGGVRE